MFPAKKNISWIVLFDGHWEKNVNTVFNIGTLYCFKSPIQFHFISQTSFWSKITFLLFIIINVHVKKMSTILQSVWKLTKELISYDF